MFSNYCGIGGSGRPRHAVDRLCKKHDHNYGILQQQGHNPYIEWNWADEEFIQALSRLQHDESVPEALVHMAATGFFRSKHTLLKFLGKAEDRQKRKHDDITEDETEETVHNQDYYYGDEGTTQLNLPAPTTMADDSMGVEAFNNKKRKADDAQDGLDTIEGHGPIWTHFPNTQLARLRWRATIFQNDQSLWGGGLVPFGNVTTTTSTPLVSTGGGALATGGTGDDLSIGSNTSALNKGYDFTNPYLIQLRMTSPYNILKTMGSVGSGNTHSEPNWLPMFDNRYQYYQCMQTDWGVTFNFGTPRTVSSNTFTEQLDYQNYKLKIFYRYTNQDDPPVAWTLNTNRVASAGAWTDNTSTGTPGQISSDYAGVTNMSNSNTGTTPLTSDDYERMGNWHMRTVTWDRTRPCTIHIGGTYKFGQCKMDIKTILPTDAKGVQSVPTAEGMSLARTTPQFPELLSIIIVADSSVAQQLGGTANSTTVPMSTQFDTSQLVNFADLRANFKFPTPNCSTVSGGQMQTDEQYFWRGATYS